MQDGKFECDPGDGLIEELLKELEDDEEDDEATIDALLQELELEMACSDERIKSITQVEETEAVVNCWDAFDVSAQSNRQVKEAGSSETRVKVEGKCCSRNSQSTGGRERDHCLIPFEDIQQQAAQKHRRQLWVPHRKHGWQKVEEVWLFEPSWVPHRKQGSCKTEHQQRKMHDASKARQVEGQHN